MTDPTSEHAEFPPALGANGRLACVAGRDGVVHVNVRNEASGPRILAVALIGLDPDWLPDPVRTAPVGPGQTVTLALPVSPSRGTLPADYPFAVSAQALDPVTGLVTSSRPGLADVVLTVSPRAQVQLKVSPAEISTVWMRRFSVQVRNTGSEPTVVHLTSTRPHNARISLADDQVRVPANSTTTVAGRARLRRPRFFGWVGEHRFSISALGDDAQTHAEALVMQRPLLPPFMAKGLAILTTLSLWLAMAVVFLPEFGQWVRSTTDQAGQKVTQKVTQKSGADEPGAGGSADGAPGDAGGSGSGEPGDGGSSSGGSGGGGSNVAPAVATTGLQLSGTVAGDRPGGVSVRLEPTSLVDEEAQGGVGVGVPDAAMASSGLRLASGFTKVSSRTAPPVRVSTTTADGSYAFAGVRSPGYYLLTFSRPGYQTRKYVIDSSSEAAKQPLEVPLSPGEGRMSGTVRGPDGGVGGVQISISDGTNTVTTSSNSKGRVGAWSLEGLSTPGAYVVQASTHNMSTEARLVNLAAGGSATADLTLVRGVATLTGRITHEGDDGKEGGLGGATVTVSDGAGSVRTATTLTQGQVGWYTIPGLKAPGTYSVTIEATGYQKRTTSLTLTKGQSRATRSALLTSSASVLSGTVSGPDGGLVGAGLVLSNADDTYKTTSTSSPSAGAYRFNGVTPGTYTLTTTMFGLDTDRVTVTLGSGRTRVINRTLAEQEGGVIPNTSVILGRVTDTDDQPLRACSTLNPYQPTCVRAEVSDTDPTTDVDTVYTTDFLPQEHYRLPKEGAPGGLRPGLHTVRVSAPGYVIGSVDVQVSRAPTVEAPTLKLQRVPVVTGQVTAALLEGTLPDTCVWVLKSGVSVPSTQECKSALQAGTVATDASDGNTTCYPVTAQWQAVDFNQKRFCAAPDTDGTYTVEVPDAGDYRVVVTPTTGTEYGSSTPVTKSLVVAGSTIVDVELARLGRLNLRVVQPGPVNSLVSAGVVDVTATPGSELGPWHTGTAGQVLLKGFEPVEHTLRATSADGKRSGSVTWTPRLNAAPDSLRLVLDEPADSLVGQVTANTFGDENILNGALVKLDIPTSYAADPGTAPVSPADMADATTDNQGCFEFRRPGTAARVTDLCAEVTDSMAVNELAIASSRVAGGTITLPGYDALAVAPNTLFTANAMPFRMRAKAVAFAATVPASHTTNTWQDAVVVVKATSGVHQGQTMAATFTTTASSSVGTLEWNASNGDGLNRIRPGLYTFTITLAGYSPTAGTLRCEVGGSCAWTTQPRLDKLGQVTIRTVSDQPPLATTAPIVALTRGDQTVTLPGTDGSVTFSDVDSNATDASATPSPEFGVSAKAAGHAFGSTAVPDSMVMSCTTAGVTTAKVVLPPGGHADCVITLRALGSVSGHVSSHAEGASGTTAVGGATVEAHRCTDQTCTTLVSPAETFTTTTDPSGNFTITGTTTHEGLNTGWWALLAKRSGYIWAGSNPHGEPVQVTGGAVPGVPLALAQTPRTVTVTVQGQDGVRLTGVTVKRAAQQAGLGTGIEAVPVNGMAGVYQFTDIPIGSWWIQVSKEGYSTETFQQPVVSDTGFQVLDTVVLAPRAASLSGSVTTDDVPAVNIAGAEVKVLCRADTDNSIACPGNSAGSVATSTRGAALKTTTGNNGSYLLDNVPAGRFDLSASRPGYVSATKVDQPVNSLDSVVWSPALTPVRSRVTWSLQVDAPGSTSPPDLSSAELVLRAPDNPGEEYRLPNNATGADVPSGCYDVTVTPPEGVEGDFSALSQNATDATLGCSEGQVLVPSTPGTPNFTVSQVFHTRALTFATSTVALPERPATPSVTVQVRRPGGQLVRTLLNPAVPLWVKPGTYVVQADLTTPSVFWEGSQVTLDLSTASQTAPLPVTEKAVPVTVQLPQSDGTITVTAGSTQQAVPPDVMTVTTGTAGLELASGTWIITASWGSGATSGTDAVQIDITDLTARTVTFRTTGDPEVLP